MKRAGVAVEDENEKPPAFTVEAAAVDEPPTLFVLVCDAKALESSSFCNKLGLGSAFFSSLVPFVVVAPKENALLDCGAGAGATARPPVVDGAVAVEPVPVSPNRNSPLVAVLVAAAPVKEKPASGAGALLLPP